MSAAPERYSRRDYRVYQAVMDAARERPANGKGAWVQAAYDNVDEWAAQHPHVDMSEPLTWREWLAESGGSV